MSKALKSLLTEPIQTNITKSQKRKFDKVWRGDGYSSAADMLRDLIRIQIKN